MANTNKYTPERGERVLQGIRAGLAYKHAGLAAGVSEDTVGRWRKGLSGAPPDFAERFHTAEGEGALALMLRIRKASDDDWRAGAWILEHRYPQEYGKTAVEHSGPEGAALEFTIQIARPPSEADDADDA
jgi:hypothetical protein